MTWTSLFNDKVNKKRSVMIRFRMEVIGWRRNFFSLVCWFCLISGATHIKRSYNNKQDEENDNQGKRWAHAVTAICHWLSPPFLNISCILKYAVSKKGVMDKRERDEEKAKWLLFLALPKMPAWKRTIVINHFIFPDRLHNMPRNCNDICTVHFHKWMDDWLETRDNTITNYISWCSNHWSAMQFTHLLIMNSLH